MKILLTGAFGNLGTSCIKVLSEQGYQIRGFDVKTPMTEKRYQKYKNTKDFEVSWGNILDKDSIKEALIGIDAIIHTAAIIPPTSEKAPELAKKVNVQGTINLVEEAESTGSIKQFIFASSVSVHGIHKPSDPLVKPTDPFKPTDNYTHTKVECEEFIHKSNLNWTVVRFGAILPVETEGQDQGGLDEYNIKLLFGIPLEQKVETICSLDAARSIVNSLNNEKAIKKVFMGGGGKNNQLIEKNFIFDTLADMGITSLPDNVFKEVKSDDDWYYTHWMDTAESQEILQFQTFSYEDYLQLKPKPGIMKKIIFKLLSPVIKRTLIRKSPYKH